MKARLRRYEGVIDNYALIQQIMHNTVLAGLLFYLYNDMSFHCLSQVSLLFLIFFCWPVSLFYLYNDMSFHCLSQVSVFFFLNFMLAGLFFLSL